MPASMAIFMVRVSFCYSILKLDKVFKIIFFANLLSSSQFYISPRYYMQNERQTELRCVLLLTEELAAVPAVVASLSERETHGTCWTSLHLLVLHPVIGSWASRLLAHRPAEDAPTPIAHHHLTMVPKGGTRMSYNYKTAKQTKRKEKNCLVSV